MCDICTDLAALLESRKYSIEKSDSVRRLHQCRLTVFHSLIFDGFILIFETCQRC